MKRGNFVTIQQWFAGGNSVSWIFLRGACEASKFYFYTNFLQKIFIWSKKSVGCQKCRLIMPEKLENNGVLIGVHRLTGSLDNLMVPTRTKMMTRRHLEQRLWFVFPCIWKVANISYGGTMYEAHDDISLIYWINRQWLHQLLPSFAAERLEGETGTVHTYIYFLISTAYMKYKDLWRLKAKLN